MKNHLKSLLLAAAVIGAASAGAQDAKKPDAPPPPASTAVTPPPSAADGTTPAASDPAPKSPEQQALGAGHARHHFRQAGGQDGTQLPQEGASGKNPGWEHREHFHHPEGEAQSGPGEAHGPADGRFQHLRVEPNGNITIMEAHGPADGHFQHPPLAPAKPTPFIGVEVGPVPPLLASQLGLGEDFGLVVETVLPDSPAAAAGIQKFDVLKLYNDQQIVDPRQLIILVKATGKDGSATLTVVRKAQEQKVTVKIGEHMAPNPLHASNATPGAGELHAHFMHGAAPGGEDRFAAEQPGRDHNWRWAGDAQHQEQHHFSRSQFGHEGFDREEARHHGFCRHGFGREGFRREDSEREGFEHHHHSGSEGFDREEGRRHEFSHHSFGREGFRREDLEREGFEHHRFGHQEFGCSEGGELFGNHGSGLEQNQRDQNHQPRNADGARARDMQGPGRHPEPTSPGQPPRAPGDHSTPPPPALPGQTPGAENRPPQAHPQSWQPGAWEDAAPAPQPAPLEAVALPELDAFPDSVSDSEVSTPSQELVAPTKAAI